MLLDLTDALKGGIFYEHFLENFRVLGRPSKSSESLRMSSIGFSTKHSRLPARDKNLMPFSTNAIPPFFFCLASNAFSDIGSVGRIEKKSA